MSANTDTEGLLMDGFEGSTNEHLKFTEVFLQNNQSESSGKCVVTGATNFVGSHSKPKDGLLSPESEPSVITSQSNASSVNCSKETSGSDLSSNGHVVSTIKKSVATGAINFEGHNRLLNSERSGVSSQLNFGSLKYVKEISEPGFSPNGPALSTTKRCIVTGAIKFEDNKSKLGDALPPPYGENPVVSSQGNINDINCLMETSRPQVASNEYVSSTTDDNVANGQCLRSSLDEPSLFNSVTCRIVESTSRGITSSCYLLRGNVSRHSFTENFGTAISSPVSQESSMMPKVMNLDDRISQCNYSMKDPRPLLRSYIQDLFKGAGWGIRKRERADKVGAEFIYNQPNKKALIRNFGKAWNLCGQGLSVDIDSLLLEDGKEWNNMASFWSDLSLTLRKVDEVSSLRKWWCLLDPFANVVFIEKKLSLLKAGKVVRTKSSLMTDSHVNEGTTKSSKNMNGNAKKSQNGSSHGLCGSSLIVGRSEQTTEANNSVCIDSFGKKAREALNRVVVQSSEEKGTHSGTFDGLDPYHLQVCGLDHNSDYFSNCLNEVFITHQDGLDALPKCVPPPQGVPSDGMDPVPVKEMANIKTPKAQSRNKRKRSVDCETEVGNDLLISLVKKKNSRSRAKSSFHETKAYRPKPLKKSKNHKGSCQLLARSLDKGGEHHEVKWFISGLRTVLSWLINCGLISLGEVIRFWNSNDGVVVKAGYIAEGGIFCTCCGQVISVSKFKSHSGFPLGSPLLSLEMGSGKPFASCQLEAWSIAFMTRKNAIRPVKIKGSDHNDDSCGLCGTGGELICCDNCPSTFHHQCLPEQVFPEGTWYCQRCTCRICGDLVNDKLGLMSSGALKCLQCDHKYHEACLKDKVAFLRLAFGGWFCSESCQEIYSGLQSHLGGINYLPDGLDWTLLRCIHGDETDHFTERVVLKADCNSKLAVALTIMEECFLPMVDARTGIDMIPHVIYNLGSEFARLNYEGFYSMVLEKDDELISVASIRIHGVAVAELPLVATCSKYRRQGMCRLLMNSIEEMLISLKVEKLVITAVPDVVEMWISFGFEPLEDHERKSLSHINLMIFPGTIWLKKSMYKAQPTDGIMSSVADGFLYPEVVDQNKIRCTNGNMRGEIVDPLHEVVSKTLYDDWGSATMNYNAKFSAILYGEESTSTLGECPLETAPTLDSVAMADERTLPKMSYEEEMITEQGNTGSQVKVF